jgi:hypothetical protein
LLKEKGWSEADERTLQITIPYYDFREQFGPKNILREQIDIGRLIRIFWTDIMEDIHSKITSNNDYLFKIQKSKDK